MRAPRSASSWNWAPCRSINENDTVATAEIRYGDNDRLAARVATMTGADCLILLSDVDGLYTANPRQRPDAKHIPEIVDASRREIEAMAGCPLPDSARGGMRSKIERGAASRRAPAAMVIRQRAPRSIRLRRMAERRAHAPVPDALDAARRAQEACIAGTLDPEGALVIDAGAVRALEGGKSLLAGRRQARSRGEFERGDAVLIRGPAGGKSAAASVGYDAADARRIIGHSTVEIEAILGDRGRGRR